MFEDTVISFCRYFAIPRLRIFAARVLVNVVTDHMSDAERFYCDRFTKIIPSCPIDCNRSTLLIFVVPVEVIAVVVKGKPVQLGRLSRNGTVGLATSESESKMFR